MSIEEIGHFFCSNYSIRDKSYGLKRLQQGILVSTEERKSFMLATQGRLLLGGDVQEIQSLNLGGGVWKLYYGKIEKA